MMLYLTAVIRRPDRVPESFTGKTTLRIGIFIRFRRDTEEAYQEIFDFSPGKKRKSWIPCIQSFQEIPGHMR